MSSQFSDNGRHVFVRVERLAAAIRNLEVKQDRHAEDMKEVKKNQQKMFKALRGIMSKLSVVTDPSVGENLPDITGWVRRPSFLREVHIKKLNTSCSTAAF